MDSGLIEELDNHELSHRKEGLEMLGVKTFRDMSSIEKETLRARLHFNVVEVNRFESLRDICIDRISARNQKPQPARGAHAPITGAEARNAGVERPLAQEARNAGAERPLTQAEARIPGAGGQLAQAEGSIKGIGIIFINMNFKDQGEREGATIDKDNFVVIFEQMGLIPLLCMDYTCKQIKQQILETTLMDFSQCEMLAVGISTHGDDGDQLYGFDGPCSLYEDILTPFKPVNCPGLRGKPKVFFIQSCRSQKQGQIQGNDSEKPCVNLESDFLLAHSTVWGYKSFRHTETGSWFVTTLRETFEKYRDTHNLEDILTFVNNSVIQKSHKASSDSEFVQTCEYVSELTKPLFFHK